MQIARADPLVVDRELKDLFRRHDRPDFPSFFDRAFAQGMRSGLRSFIGRDDDGRLVAHIGQFPHPFTHRGGAVTGGLVTNLMVAREQRTFFPALSLVRQLVNDARAAGLDFLYGDPTPAAQIVLKRSGFVPVDALTRFVIPTSHAMPLMDALVRLYHILPRRSRSLRDLRVETLDPKRLWADAALAMKSDDRPMAVRPLHEPEIYARRLESWPSGRDRYFRVAPLREGVPAVALARGPNAKGVAAICALYPSCDVQAPLLIAAVVRQFRRLPGCRTVQIWSLANSRLAATLHDLGFIARGDDAAVFALSLTERGAEVVRAAPHWEITDLDCDR